MGIFIHLAVSKSVTQKEWTEVYEESLEMADRLGLAELREVTIHGTKVACLTKTREREYSQRGETCRGWTADGDYRYLTLCESNGLDRDICYTLRTAAVDPLLALSRDENGSREEGNPWEGDYVSFWDGKTQGEPQHMSLLAIACMAEERLPGRAFVYGDITRGQCKEAVRIANSVLDRKIRIPDRCDLERFYARVQKFPADETDRLRAFTEYYLGVKDAAFGAFLREHFPEQTLDEYWRKRFGSFPVNRLGYGSIYREYMTQGFDLAKLCRMSVLTDKEADGRKKDLTETFIRKIMSSELYVQKKDCEDVLDLNTDEPEPYGIPSLMAQFFFAGARNERVDRYISLDEIRTVLREELGNRCDVDGIVDSCLAEKAAPKEKSAPDQLRDMIHAGVDTELQNREDYRIHSCRALQFYRSGDSVKPEIRKFICQAHEFCRNLLREHASYFEELSEGPLEKKLEALGSRSTDLVLRDRDWEKIFQDVEQHPESLERYWPATCVMMNSDDILALMQAYVRNDALYRDLVEGKLQVEDTDSR